MTIKRFHSCLLFCIAFAPLAELWVHVCTFRRSTHKNVHQHTSLLFARTRIVVVGGGWAGLSVTDSLSHSSDVHITLLDAGSAVGGLAGGGALSPRLQLPVEPGLHGFWREYRNTLATLERIGVMPLTECTPSILVSQHGRVALARVLVNETVDDTSCTGGSLEDTFSQWLPPPLDLALLSEFTSQRLSPADRISALGLLSAWADFEPESREAWLRYDAVSAEALFRSAGVTPALYDELVAPLLHVLPMTTGYDCSAAAALSCFHVFALQSKGAFDVRWCTGSIGQTIFRPWIEQMTARGNVDMLAGKRVTDIVQTPSGSYQVTVQDSAVYDCDAVVMAVGGTALKRLALHCPVLQVPESRYWKDSLRGVTCVAVRLFLDPNGPTPWLAPMKDSPVVVCGPNLLPELVETGFCIYDLNRLQPTVFSNVTALEVDFFRAEDIANMENDDDVAVLALRAVVAALQIPVPDPSLLLLLEVHVIRARNAVSHFCLDSAKPSPGVRAANKGLYFCGDWIDRTGHSSWSTEKAVVTGRQAAAAMATDFGLPDCDTDVIPAAPDTPPLAALRTLARLRRSHKPPLPFV